MGWGVVVAEGVELVAVRCWVGRFVVAGWM